MRRALISWSVAFALLIGAFAITVVALNSTLYSAGGFVGTYLDALARQDATTARTMPGVVAAEDLSAELLTDDALPGLSAVELTDDRSGSDGVHTVSYSYDLDGTEASSDFRVVQTGAFLGLFPTWAFETSPLATAAVTVLHDERFRVNGQQLSNADATDEAGNPAVSASYLVFAPGVYDFDHSSTFLTADAVTVPVTEPGSVTAVQVNVQANPAFVEQVDTELRDYLDECATQQVLLPTGCPFGKTFDNRVDSTPEWSMADYPRVEIVPGSETGTWLMPESGAAAHLRVDIRSLFDGTVTEYDKDIDFDVSYSITIEAADELYIQEISQ